MNQLTLTQKSNSCGKAEGLYLLLLLWLVFDPVGVVVNI